MAKARYWTCQRKSAGVKCGQRNQRIKRKCTKCGGAAPAVRKPFHMQALVDPYEVWEKKYGDQCNICGRRATGSRRLNRDHDHKTGKPRGLLCTRCNRALPAWMTIEWLWAARAYLRRAAKDN